MSRNLDNVMKKVEQFPTEDELLALYKEEEERQLQVQAARRVRKAGIVGALLTVGVRPIKKK